MNIANKITISRLVITILFIIAMAFEAFPAKTLGLLLFVLACITDYYDGMLARKYGLITPFGELSDPLADKILISAAFIAFLKIPAFDIPAWAVVAIIAREFTVTGIRLIAASQGTIIPAITAGKQKTVIQMVCVITLLLFLSAQEILSVKITSFPGALDVMNKIAPGLSFYLILITALFTLYSGYVYVKKNMGLFTSKGI